VSGLQLTTAAEIAAALEGRREGRQWRCRCPIHGGRSLLVRDGNVGRILVFCHGGCEARDVLAELRRSGLLDGPSENYQVPAMRRNDHLDDTARTARALAVWREARPADGTIVETYLANRGLALLPPQYIRFHPDCPHPSGRLYPAMVALVEHSERGPVGVHRTYLRPDGSGKAAVETAKASLGPIAGGAVQLATIQPGRWTVISEGIETALSVGQSCGLPTWAALSAGGIRNLVLPAEARMVLICADNDPSGTGQRASQSAAERFLAEGRRVRIALPPVPGTDFNARRVACQPPFPGLQELLRPGVIQTLGDAFVPAEFRDAVFATQAIQYNADFLLGWNILALPDFWLISTP
jgi:putative DNA primase/helicase